MSAFVIVLPIKLVPFYMCAIGKYRALSSQVMFNFILYIYLHVNIIWNVYMHEMFTCHYNKYINKTTTLK